MISVCSSFNYSSFDLPAKLVRTELEINSHERSPDSDLEVGHFAVMDVEVTVSGKDFGGDTPHLESVTDRAQKIISFLQAVHVEATIIAFHMEVPALIQIPVGT